MRKLVFSIVFLIISLANYAQYRHEIGPSIGVGYYLGDIVNNHFIGEPHMNYGLMYRMDLNSRFAVRIAGHYGKISGYSENNKPSLRYKNLSFESPLTDIEMGLEINFLEYQAGSKNHRFTPFIFTGISVFKFNPKTYFQGKWIELQPLGTEGQGTTEYPDRKPYSLTSWAIPFGGGIKWNVSKLITIGVEYGLRKTFTDYLDDVSTTYAKSSVLAAEKSPLSSMLGNRMFEDEALAMGLNLNIGSNNIPESQDNFETYLAMQSTTDESQRGLVTDKDWYGIICMTVTIKLIGPKNKKCPAYKNNKYYREYNL